jgi:hypothetical protein
VCQASKEMTSQCCPQEKGQARLTVTVMNAKGLWGDITSETDGLVKVLSLLFYLTKTFVFKWT